MIKIHRLVRSGRRGAVAVGMRAAKRVVPYFLALAEKWTTVRRYQNLNQATTLLSKNEPEINIIFNISSSIRLIVQIK